MKQTAPAAARNRDPIAEVLRGELPEQGTVLEIAAGTGEHAVHFAAAFPALHWQPTDPDLSALQSIAAWREEAGLPNLRAPLALDAASADWPVSAADAVVCINMIHISPWASAEGLFAGAARLLGQGAPLVLYGPYLEDGVETAPSNIAFDHWLKEKDARFGIRRIEDVDALAARNGFARTSRVEMPANNLTLTYRKR
ncbi:SAM-dependent methyltransferase [Erythrobacter sp. SG61-1L]|uniref:DUF938 domain-containing protein n=1 Tax=Erythrobacter sp. SG61-1L TaxID=1603897 RepID=UPI0006C8F0F2|nr:DUF938 domain-containing protein [Erythrobacter sp. SG61-1L]KPL67091.1 SAM-dependent methyltransferase [Erythrobacter sp. SG61-1L]